jgi:hypothetical protein
MSGLSIPMPNALVATTTAGSPEKNLSWTSARVAAVRPP